ncbi:Uncharacterised protein [Chlamydia trachomatis]|nr:Uncharacterised protein [Chlamydia trachomatis]
MLWWLFLDTHSHTLLPLVGSVHICDISQQQQQSRLFLLSFNYMSNRDHQSHILRVHPSILLVSLVSTVLLHSLHCFNALVLLFIYNYNKWLVYVKPLKSKTSKALLTP